MRRTIEQDGETFVLVPEQRWLKMLQSLDELHVRLIHAGRVNSGREIAESAEIYIIDLEVENRLLRDQLKAAQQWQQ